MTRGQEGRVVGWTAQRYPKWKGRQHLDTLYVELLNPPRNVKLPHLPRNVVPLTKNTESVEAQLPNDEFACVSRSQVSVLPNFAMTDYSLQGKTREWNVVDLAECRNFQAAYTCLSRGTTFAQTLIVRDFDDDLLRGSLDGALRQEYRELEYLNVITQLRFDGFLPDSIMQRSRWETIGAYRLWKAAAGSTVEQAPQLGADDLAPPQEYIQYGHETWSHTEKRKAQDVAPATATAKRARTVAHATLANSEWASPVGPVWDATDWSCAYDSWVFIIHVLWLSDRVKWSRVFQGYGQVMGGLLSEMERMPQQDPEQEITGVRDALRNRLREQNVKEFPRGRGGVDLFTLTENLLDYFHITSQCAVTCVECNSRGQATVATPVTLGRFACVRASATVQQYVDQCLQAGENCGACGGDTLVVHNYAELISFEVVEATPSLVVEDRIKVGDWGMYRLVGVIYYGDFHFVSRAFTRDNKVYYHDGIEGSNSTFEGVLTDTFLQTDLNVCRGKRMSLVVYALADRWIDTAERSG